jgi:hypothetical protein
LDIRDIRTLDGHFWSEHVLYVFLSKLAESNLKETIKEVWIYVRARKVPPR